MCVPFLPLTKKSLMLVMAYCLFPSLLVRVYKSFYLVVGFQTGDEIKEFREKKMNSPWRDPRHRPIEESLDLFEKMRRGEIEEGKATLRMKQDMQSDNPNMHDLIAYRIKASFVEF